MLYYTVILLNPTLAATLALQRVGERKASNAPGGPNCEKQLQQWLARPRLIYAGLFKFLEYNCLTSRVSRFFLLSRFPPPSLCFILQEKQQEFSSYLFLSFVYCPTPLFFPCFSLLFF